MFGKRLKDLKPSRSKYILSPLGRPCNGKISLYCGYWGDFGFYFSIDSREIHVTAVKFAPLSRKFKHFYYKTEQAAAADFSHNKRDLFCMHCEAEID